MQKSIFFHGVRFLRLNRLALRWLCVFVLGSVVLQAQSNDSEQVDVRVGKVLVLANKNRADSVEIATEYCRARSLPAANLLRLDLKSPISINGSDYNTRIQVAVDQRLKELGPSIDYIVIVRGVPYRVNKQSVTAALTFGGLKNILPEQPFYEQQRSFDGTFPCHGTFLKPTTALITWTVHDALQLIRRSLVTYPAANRGGMFYFCNGVGPRGIRNRLIPQAIARMHALNANATHDTEPNLSNRLDIIAQFTGIPVVKMTSNVYRPGSLLDNVTSWGGYLLDPRSHTTLTEMVRHGVCGAYGTVVEPTNNPTRWPTFTLPMHYARGFNLADSYLASVRDISLGVVVGDPLMAPFSKPPRVELDWIPAASDALDAEGTIEFSVAAAQNDANAGLAAVELWADDSHRVAVFTPTVPAGSEILFQVMVQGREITSKNLTLDKDTPLPKALARLTQKTPGQPLQIIQGGEYGDKLLIRSAIPSNGNAIQARLEIRTDESSRVTTTPLIARPVLSQVAVFDASGPDARAGDTVTVRLGDETVSFQAETPMATPQFLEQLARRLNRLPQVGSRQEWVVQIPGAATPFRGRQMWIIPNNPKEQLSIPVVVSIDRAEGSRFAAGFKDKPLPWRMMPVAGLAETVLTAPALTDSVRHSLRIPKKSLSPGFHRFQCVAVASDGSRSTKTLDLVIPSSEKPVDDWAKIKGDVYDPGEELAVLLDPPSHVAKAFPVLVLDGRPVAIWDMDSPVVALKLDMPLVCPGFHEAWIEWQTDARLPSAGTRRQPMARSLPLSFKVRRPLDYKLTWSPHKTEERDVQLTFSGVYLHDDVDVIIDGRAVKLKRHPTKGDTWSAKLENLTPGSHTLMLRGHRELDTPTELTPPLQVEGATPPTRPVEK